MCDHTSPDDREDWAAGNRIMCDFIHRGVVAPVVPTEVHGSPGFLPDADGREARGVRLQRVAAADFRVNVLSFDRLSSGR